MNNSKHKYNTRYDKFKEYRQEIESNIKLQELVETSNKKISIFKRRLLEIFPNYDTIYKSKTQKLNFQLHKINKLVLLDINEIKNSINKLENLQNNWNQKPQTPQFLEFENVLFDDLLEKLKQIDLKFLDEKNF